MAVVKAAAVAASGCRHTIGVIGRGAVMVARLTGCCCVALAMRRGVMVLRIRRVVSSMAGRLVLMRSRGKLRWCLLVGVFRCC